jgi:Zn-dependent protease with chaperone function
VETFTGRNRARIAALLVASVANYFVAVLLVGAALGITIVLWGLSKVGELPSTGDGWKFLGIGTLVMAALGAIVAFAAALVGLPRARRRLESAMLHGPGVTVVQDATEHRRLVNIVDALAIAAGIPSPSVAVIGDPAPNAFAVGTRPSQSVIGVTTGLLQTLPRPQIEAVVAFEITQVASLDVALTTWVVALTAEVSRTMRTHAVAAMAATFNARFARRMRGWALRDSAAARDRAAIAMSKNPAALVAALERLADDPSIVASMTPDTAALWIEVPESIADPSHDDADPTLRSYLLRERIGALRTLASLPAS